MYLYYLDTNLKTKRNIWIINFSSGESVTVLAQGLTFLCLGAIFCCRFEWLSRTKQSWLLNDLQQMESSLKNNFTTCNLNAETYYLLKCILLDYIPHVCLKAELIYQLGV